MPPITITLSRLKEEVRETSKHMLAFEGGDDADYDYLIEEFERLKIQATIQKVFAKTAKSLRGGDKHLPDQFSSRLKQFIKFAYEPATNHRDRQQKLRQLEPNDFKFCGLCFKLTDIYIMPMPRFTMLVEIVGEYVRLHGIASCLYREDISRAMFTPDIDVEDVESYQNFLACLLIHILPVLE
jgi:hypothetical protein